MTAGDGDSFRRIALWICGYVTREMRSFYLSFQFDFNFDDKFARDARYVLWLIRHERHEAFGAESHGFTSSDSAAFPFAHANKALSQRSMQRPADIV